MRRWRDGVDGDAEGPLRYVKRSLSVFPLCVVLVQRVLRSDGHYYRRLQDPKTTDGLWTVRAALGEALHARSNQTLYWYSVE